MKTAVPGEIIDSRRSLEKDNRCPRRNRRLAGDAFGQARDLEIVEPANQSALDALSEEFVEHTSPNLISKMTFRLAAGMFASSPTGILRSCTAGGGTIFEMR